MNKYSKEFFDFEIDRRNTASYKWDKMDVKNSEDVLPMWVADMDFRCPTEVTTAINKRANHQVYGYTEQTKDAISALLSFQKRRHGTNLSPENHLLIPCVVTGIRLAVLGLTQQGDKIVVQPPVYPPFYDAISSNSRVIVKNNLVPTKDGIYNINYEDLESSFKNGAKMLIMCSPHNPVARVWTKEELEKVWRLCKKHNVILVVDEIHQDFVFDDNKFISALSIDESTDAKILVLTSAGKTFNLAGLQQGVALSRNKDLLGTISSSAHKYGSISGNIFALSATEVAYSCCDEWLDGLIAYLNEGKDILKNELNKCLPKAKMTPQQATFLAWIDLREYGFTTKEIINRCREQRVEFTPGTYFDTTAGEGFIRLNFGCPHKHIIQAVSKLKLALMQ